MCALLAPMYLDFVQVLTCVYRPDSGVSAAYHDPLRSRAEAPKDGGRPVEGAVLEKTPLRVVVEELAHAIVADRRERRDPPVVLERFVDSSGSTSSPRTAPREGRAVTALDGRCGTCARFVRVHEHTDDRGVTRRAGECLLEVWSPPIFENNTCSQYLLRGTFAATVQAKKKAAPFRPRGA
ncbi:MAG: hypothetical protein U0169_13785 [Polyangiaceae bacterium]